MSGSRTPDLRFSFKDFIISRNSFQLLSSRYQFFFKWVRKGGGTVRSFRLDFPRHNKLSSTFLLLFTKLWECWTYTHRDTHTHAHAHVLFIALSHTHTHSIVFLTHSQSFSYTHTHPHTGKYNYRHRLQYADTSTDKPKYTNTHINALEWTHSFTFSILHTFAHTQFLSLLLLWSVRMHLSIKCF